MSWASADLLASLKAVLKLSTSDERATDADLYTFLSEGQRMVMGLAATHDGFREANLTIEQGTTSDSGKTYTFPSLTSAPLWFLCRDGKTGPVLVPGEEYQDLDFTPEGAVIRIPNDRTRTFTNGLWARYVASPAVIDANTAPVLQPDYARQLVIYQAAALWASAGGLRDPGPYESLFQKRAFGDSRNPGDVGLVGQLKQSFAFYGASGSPQSAVPARWYLGQGWI